MLKFSKINIPYCSNYKIMPVLSVIKILNLFTKTPAAQKRKFDSRAKIRKIEFILGWDQIQADLKGVTKEQTCQYIVTTKNVSPHN